MLRVTVFDKNGSDGRIFLRSRVTIAALLTKHCRGRYHSAWPYEGAFNVKQTCYTRLSAAALLIMMIVIQIFVVTDAWWPVHSLWVALALVLIVKGSGLFALDAFVARGCRT